MPLRGLGWQKYWWEEILSQCVSVVSLNGCILIYIQNYVTPSVKKKEYGNLLAIC